MSDLASEYLRLSFWAQAALRDLAKHEKISSTDVHPSSSQVGARMLNLLVKKGLAKTVKHHGRMRPDYAITDTGRAVLDAGKAWIAECDAQSGQLHAQKETP